EFDHVRNRALGGIRQAPNHQVRTELRPRSASGAARPRPAAPPRPAPPPPRPAAPSTSALLIALGLGRRYRTATRTGRSIRAFLLIHQHARPLFRQVKPLPAFSTRRLSGSEIDDHHSVLRRGLFVFLRFVDLRLCRE